MMGKATDDTVLKIGIMGAGAIGLYVGGMLAQSGARVVFAARGRTLASVQRGLSLSRYDGFKATLKPEQYEVGSAGDLAGCPIVLFCTKSGDTEAAALELAKALQPGATVISLQNGVGNVEMLKRLLAPQEVVAGTVPFNVVRLSPNAVHCSMEGRVLVGPSKASTRLASLAEASHLQVQVHDNLDAMQWGKLLLNLNNGLNVISGLPLRQQFNKPGYRTVLAMAMEELIAALDAAGIPVIGATRTNPRLIPKVLRLPSWLFRIAARQQLRMDETARSSSWDDLKAGREPETRFLNGAVCSLAEAHGLTAPVNELICRLVAETFAAGASPEMPGEELLALARKAAA
ncbi:2-dehydropantoate 2-reductase [uncultured Hoeflea sp.]|uniref:2-dehydropantoate 2-reductase n=1 Tax=uncultured Hoeflea sp. TaxID=538666 RepID=UPI0030D9BBF7